LREDGCRNSEKKHVGLQAGLDRGVELSPAQQVSEIFGHEHASTGCSERKLSPAVFNSSMFDQVSFEEV
jgi:hypothetical protein